MIFKKQNSTAKGKTVQRAPPRDLRLADVAYCEAPQIDRLLFICGLHRSGTTLVERYVTQNFLVSYLRADVPESEGQHMQTVYKVAKKYGGAGRFAFDQKMDDDLALLDDYENQKRNVLNDWARYVVGDHSDLVEKSPPNLTKINWLRDVFPGSKFLIIVRDPRAVSAATQKWSATSLPELMMHWNVAHAKALGAYRQDDCLSVKYEQFCDDPFGELARIAKFANLAPVSRDQELEPRFAKLSNSNEEYIARHECRAFGPGVWNQFGYDI